MSSIKEKSKDIPDVNDSTSWQIKLKYTFNNTISLSMSGIALNGQSYVWSLALLSSACMNAAGQRCVLSFVHSQHQTRVKQSTVSSKNPSQELEAFGITPCYPSPRAQQTPKVPNAITLTTGRCFHNASSYLDVVSQWSVRIVPERASR